MWRNGCINDTYEPGSTFKIITSSACLEEGVVSLDDTFMCPGYRIVEDRKIRCHKVGGHGSETFVQGIQNSCNPVFIDIGLRLGAEKFYDYFEKFGLLSLTNVDLPGEAGTIMHKKEDIGTVELATMTFGQSFQITPIQLATTVSSIVNGGRRITPHLGMAVLDSGGEVIEEFEYEVQEGIVSEKTSETMRTLLKSVVEEGSGKNGYIEGYSIGGKTATSQTLPRSANKYIASFLGFAPAEDPVILGMVVIHNPQGVYYGGTIAAPVLRSIYDNVLPYLGMKKADRWVILYWNSAVRQEKGGQPYSPARLKLLIETKEMKRWIYEQSCSDSGIDLICGEPCAGPCGHTVFAETENEADRACGRGSVSSEESGDSYDGGNHNPRGYYRDVPVYVKDYPKIIPVLFLTVAFGLIGFLDDYLKVVLKRSDGLLPMQKMALQIVVTAVFAFYIVKVAHIPLTLLVPFSGGFYWDIGWLAVPVLFVAVIGTVNGTNFTDGLDGLASSVTVLVATFFTVVAVGTQSGIEPITCAVVGALLGFLLFNVYPASVFMGDTGSLALGGFVAGTAYMMQMPLFIIIVGFIYLVEVASVILQVTYFKKTGGKRLFKMAPIHHHFELCGWSETRVVAVFSVITALLCLIALMGV